MAFFNRNRAVVEDEDKKSRYSEEGERFEWIARTDMLGRPCWQHRETGQCYYGNPVPPTPVHNVHIVSPTSHTVQPSVRPSTVYPSPAPWGPTMVPVSPTCVIPDANAPYTR